MYEQLTVYCKDGTTLAFFEVGDVVEDTRILKFSYISKTTGKANSAQFTISNIAGYSLSLHPKQ